MQIGTASGLINPTQIEKLVDVVAIDVEALGGVARLTIESGKLIVGARFLWDGLTQAECNALQDAIDEATDNYVLVGCPGLGGIWTTIDPDLTDNQMYMTLMPGSPPSVDWLAESTEAGSMVGYAVRADFVSYPR